MTYIVPGSGADMDKVRAVKAAMGGFSASEEWKKLFSENADSEEHPQENGDANS